MHTNPTDPTTGRVDRGELDRHITEMYRAVANQTADELHFPTGRALAEALGYPIALLDRLPAEAVASFAGVGYHLGLARLLPGERVLDLGSGSGMDAFAAAAQVGPVGAVTGVDMTPEQLAKSERLRRDGHVSLRRARIEELPFEDGAFDAVISNGVVQSLGRQAQGVRRGGTRAPAGRTARARRHRHRAAASRAHACQADLWAACIAGASQADLYLQDIAAAGLKPQLVHANPGYRFTSERAKRTSDRYGAHSISLLALKPVRASRHTPGPDLGGGADAARPAREEAFANTTTTEEVSK